jgi:F-type H+-transporting ATPase subunit gamma
MSDSLQDLQRRIESATELHSITRTMRSLAAVNLRHHDAASRAISAHEAIVADGLQAVLRDGALERLPDDEPDADAATAIVVFGSNQGLCGPINRHVVAHALDELDRWPTVALVAAVGERVAAELELAGCDVAATWDLPGTADGIPPRAEHLLVRADEWRLGRDVRRIQLVHPSYASATRTYEATSQQLTPTDRRWLERLAARTWRSRSLPTWTLGWDRLVAELLREATLVHLHHAFAQTMVSVAASRLGAMETAQHDIEERLDRLRWHHRELRQAQITEELFDIVSGFEVLEPS